MGTDDLGDGGLDLADFTRDEMRRILKGVRR